MGLTGALAIAPARNEFVLLELHNNILSHGNTQLTNNTNAAEFAGFTNTIFKRWCGWWLQQFQQRKQQSQPQQLQQPQQQQQQQQQPVEEQQQRQQQQQQQHQQQQAQQPMAALVMARRKKARATPPPSFLAEEEPPPPRGYPEAPHGVQRDTYGSGGDAYGSGDVIQVVPSTHRSVVARLVREGAAALRIAACWRAASRHASARATVIARGVVKVTRVSILITGNPKPSRDTYPRAPQSPAAARDALTRLVHADPSKPCWLGCGDAVCRRGFAGRIGVPWSLARGFHSKR